MVYKASLSILALLLASSTYDLSTNAIQIHSEALSHHRASKNEPERSEKGEPAAKGGKDSKDGDEKKGEGKDGEKKDKLDVCSRYGAKEEGKEEEKEEKEEAEAPEEEKEEAKEEKGDGEKATAPPPVPLLQEKLLEDTPKYIAEETKRYQAKQKRLAKEVKAFAKADKKAFKAIDKKLKEVCGKFKKSQKTGEEMPADESYRTVEQFQALVDQLRSNIDGESQAILDIYLTEAKKRPPTTLEPAGSSSANIKAVATQWATKRFDIQEVLHKIGQSGAWLMDETWWEKRQAQTDGLVKRTQAQIQKDL